MDWHRRRLNRLAAQGALTRLLPGIFAPEDTWHARVLAAQLNHPDAVLCGAAAARATFWPELPEGPITLAGCRHSGAAPWLRTSQAPVPRALRVQQGELCVTAAPLTVLDLIPTLGGQAIDEALRRRAVTLTSLHHGLDLTPGRPGNDLRRVLLHDSRENPWSEFEREAHQLLRSEHLRGWRGNHFVRVGSQIFYPDVAFPGVKLCLEFDGQAFHRTLAELTRDARRQNALVLSGWTVLRYTIDTLPTMPGQVRQAMRRLGAPTSRVA